MSAAVYILAAVVVALLVALVLCWMQPRRKASPDNTISLRVELNGADDVIAQLDGLTAKAAHLADMLARARWRKAVPIDQGGRSGHVSRCR